MSDGPSDSGRPKCPYCGYAECKCLDISNEAIFLRFGYADAGMVEAIRDEAKRREREACAEFVDWYMIYAPSLADELTNIAAAIRARKD